MANRTDLMLVLWGVGVDFKSGAGPGVDGKGVPGLDGGKMERLANISTLALFNYRYVWDVQVEIDFSVLPART